MSKPAAGALEQPGKNIRAKSGLNKSILDQGWFELRRQLDYKLAWHGGVLITMLKLSLSASRATSKRTLMSSPSMS